MKKLIWFALPMLLLAVAIAEDHPKAVSTIKGKTYSFTLPKGVTYSGMKGTDTYAFRWGSKKKSHSGSHLKDNS